MKNSANNFIPAARIAISDPDLQEAVGKGTSVAETKRQAAIYAEGNAHGEALRTASASAKRRALQNLPDLLEAVEEKMTAKEINVLWAVDAEEANRLVLEIAARHGVRSVVKAKSMVTEEIGLNHALEAAGIDVLETDLGEFIVQIAEETPSHIVTPIMHKTKDMVRDLLIEKLEMPYTDEAGEMTAFVRAILRERFLNADMGVSGGNFLIAETGSIGLVSNEGNIRMVDSLPPLHVAVIGIEKVVATLEDYALLTQMLPRSGTGQKLTVYTQMINGPRREDEPDGPDHLYVILLDNGRSEIYAGDYAEALACIRCGACLNACPVYRSTGGHAYGWVYPGPIGSVVSPLLLGKENASPLPFASSLCGNCKTVCPVDIDIPRMLLDLRHDLVEAKKGGLIWGVGIAGWATVNRSAILFEAAGKLASAAGDTLPDSLPGPLSGWTDYRDSPKFPGKSFRQRWRERKAKDQK